MSNLQNDVFFECWAEAKEELERNKKEIVEKELIKMIQSVSDWQVIEETLRDYSNGLLSKEQMEEEVAFYIGGIEKRTKDSEKISIEEK
ncbi:MAG: hypothetical protein WC288_01935 [Candidatus Paceibacterota bacterium]|jgi:hypothetical protein